MLERDAALDRLDPLVGEWETEGTHPLLTGVIPGRATFEWLTGRTFLIWRTETPPGTIPPAIAVIGGGDVSGVWQMHYFDSRGVSRIYQASMDDGVFRFWRDHPGFSQRATGVFEDEGRVLRLRTELDQDGTFRPDLEVTYRRR
jgi:hypothetical protein